MLDISFEVDGKRYTVDDVKDEMAKAIHISMINSIQSVLGHIKCPIHGLTPKLIIKGNPLVEELKIVVSNPCCQKIVELVRMKENQL